jgi:hypothetical protein
MYRMFQKGLYNDIPNVTLWRVSRKYLYSKIYKQKDKQTYKQTTNRSRCLRMDRLYSFKYKYFRDTRHRVTLGNHCKALFEASQ